jgi:hypothetical protein
MTTEITVEIKGGETILDAAKAVQADARADYEEQKKLKKAKEAAEAEERQRQADEEDEYKGAIREDEEESKPENRLKSRKCGFWIYRDQVIGRPDLEADTPFERTGLDQDIFQLSVGTGDGRKWATHYFEGPAGKPATGIAVTGSVTLVGYLSYIRFYADGLGTVYTLPEGATVVPYDPVVYLDPDNPPGPGVCPNNFCWTLFFPDELSSGPGRSRKNVTVTKVSKKVNAYEPTCMEQNIFNFPINDKKTIVVVANWLGWSMGEGGEMYSSVWPDQYFLHPQNISQPSIRSTVYYKYPGGEETGWQPIYGYYWLMDPADETVVLTNSTFGAIFPLDNTITHVFEGQPEIDIAAFVVGPNDVKKIDNIPSAVAEKIKARCPAPVWDDSNIYWARWEIRGPLDQIPGYPSQIDEYWNNASWMINPDALSMGVARNLFREWEYDGYYLPYDYWNRELEFQVSNYSAPNTHQIPPLLGASPGIYDAYDADLQDHAFYNHFGKGDWYDSWGFTYSTQDSWTSEYGDVRIHTGDIREGAWAWLALNPSLANGSQGVCTDDIAWLYLKPEEREAFIDNFRFTYYDYTATIRLPFEFTAEQREHLLINAPEDPVFNYIYIERNVDAGNLVDGVKWISNGEAGSWTDANSPAFDYNQDPFWDQPYMDIDDSRWVKYKYKTKLSNQRVWPPSISAGFEDPVPSSVSTYSKANHPLANGWPQISYVINTAWGNDYSQVLLAMGFEAGDLNV